LLRWTPIAAVVGVLAGSASALLLWSLDVATRIREAHVWIIWLLAPVGWVMGMVYKTVGRDVEKGNDLIMDEVHAPQRVLPLRMTPLILFATFLTHVFGGSAGREGTAVQTGASLADQLAKPLRMGAASRRVLLMAGMSGGFGSVFGTPLAGAVFGMEVLATGNVSYEAIAPCFVAAFVGDLVTRAWGIHHEVYRIPSVPVLHAWPMVLAMIAGAVFGWMAMFFARSTHAVQDWSRRLIPRSELRPVVGGLAVSCAVFALHTTKYIGLGIPETDAAFQHVVPWYDFMAKSLFTTATLGMGFKGGEVTPLFFIGATLGNALSHILPLPMTLLASMGFVAVFAGAANVPIASALMAVELFGGEVGVYAAIACVGSYLFSGQTGIYHGQRPGRGKLIGGPLSEAMEAKADPHDA
jgi:H+/Cl- antiporter ClcA